MEGGYTGIKNVYQANSPKDDVQQSFFLAESLKVIKREQNIYNGLQEQFYRGVVQPLFVNMLVFNFHIIFSCSTCICYSVMII